MADPRELFGFLNKKPKEEENIKEIEEKPIEYSRERVFNRKMVISLMTIVAILVFFVITLTISKTDIQKDLQNKIDSKDNTINLCLSTKTTLESDRIRFKSELEALKAQKPTETKCTIKDTYEPTIISNQTQIIYRNICNCTDIINGSQSDYVLGLIKQIKRLEMQKECPYLNESLLNDSLRFDLRECKLRLDRIGDITEEE